MNQTPQKLWTAALGEVELSLSQANYSTWIKPIKFIDYEPGVYKVGVPNGFTKARIENKYQPLLEKTLSRHLGEPTKIICQIVDSPAPSTPHADGLFNEQLFAAGRANRIDGIQAIQPTPPAVDTTSRSFSSPLNRRFTFENFVVGNHTKLAHAASQAVAENPGAAYNPLFLYGDVGLGKTHLMHAIAQKIIEQDPASIVVYVTSEQFTNKLISSIRTGKTEQFRQKYRPVDILLVDDVQFIAGKETTQEEFFHTFNFIYEAGHQVVLSSDRPPKAIPTLEARLQSRFASGLVADIQKPDFETRTAILESKARSNGFSVPPDVIYHIANVISSNVRELEGALIRIVSHCKVYGLPVTKDIAANILSMASTNPISSKVSLKKVLDCVCEYYHVDKAKVLGKSRIKTLVVPRQIAMFLMRELGDASLNQIGAEFGGKDHTTVLHSCQKIQALFEEDDVIKSEIEEIKRSLYN